ncbi:hypothetical protein FRC05_008749 [Tulasnella sp. 425]|nr:hypothetical protein FRC05_008749 [Tulasnella sp. 425]
MVTTRRKSTVSYKDVSDDEMDIDGFVHESDLAKPSKKRAARDDAEDDSDDDAKPKGKKTKTTNTTTKKKGKISARTLMKDLFSALPLDLIYEIFGHVHPLDLLSLARTTKVLRSHLMSKRSISVWKTAREAVIPPVPECPKDQSEPQWAKLLFTHDCTMCGAPRIQKVDWNLRLRGCEVCFKTNRKFYFSAHIDKTAEIVDDFQLRIDAGIKGARAEFDEFVEKKKAEAAEQAESGKRLKEWAKDATAMRSVLDHQLRAERKQAMVAKLVELGHDPRDVENASQTSWNSVKSIFNSATPLSDSVWKRAKPKAEMLVEEAKQRRLDRERRPTRDARQNIAKSRYAAFKKTYDSSPDNFLPSEYTFTNLPVIKEVIRSEGDDVSPTIFDDVFKTLPDFFDEWRRERRIDLAKLLLESQATPGDVIPDAAAAEKAGILLLATSAFSSCVPWSNNDRPSVHWMNMINQHFLENTSSHPATGPRRAHYEELRCIRVDPETIEKAKELVLAVGLDPNTATQLDMDEVDARFWCKDCSVVKSRKIKVARNWRNCIIHLGFHTDAEEWKDWEVLSPEDRKTIENREKAVTALQVIDWNTKAISLQGVVVNLRGHGYGVKTAAPPRPPPGAGPSNANTSKSRGATIPMYKCKLCPGSNRLFQLKGLEDHTKAK